MIGFIFGENDFPKYILKKVKNKEKFLIIDLTIKKHFKKFKNSYPVSLGQFGKIISILKSYNCKKVLFAGKVKKPNFSKLKLDFKGVYYMPKIIKSAKLGDETILKEIIKIFKKENIQTLSSNVFTPELSLPRGTYTKIKPNKKDMIDIIKASRALKKSGDYSHVQGSISFGNQFTRLEGRKGTNQTLKNIKEEQRKR